MWCSFDGTHILVNTEKGRQKYRNLSRRPAVTILAIDPDDDSRWLEVRGTVVGETEEGAVFGDPEVMRFSDDIQTMQWVHDWLGRCLDNDQQKSGIGPWAVVEKRSRETIGYCGLFHFPDVRGGRCQTSVSIGTNPAPHLREEA